ESGRQQGDAALAQEALSGVPRERLFRFGPAHAPARAVRRGIQRLGNGLAADHVAWRSHRAWDDAAHTDAGRGRTLAMYDDLCFRSIRKPMPLSPREVVMILDVEQHVYAERPRDMRVNERMIRRRIFSHQFHGRPVFLARVTRQIQPREMGELLRQFRMQIARAAAGVLGHLRDRAAAARETEQRDVLARAESDRVVKDAEASELDDVVAAPAP